MEEAVLDKDMNIMVNASWEAQEYDKTQLYYALPKNKALP
jgi:hypothetical protein